MRKPGVSRGTRNMVVPSRSGTLGLLRASMKNNLPTLALAMKHFSPLRIHSSPWRSARSLRPALGSSGGSRAVSAPFLGDGQGAKAELRALLDDLPVEGLARIVDLVALERDRAVFLFREFARRHLPGALFVAQGKIHGACPFFIPPRARRRPAAADSSPAPRRGATSPRCFPRPSGGRCAHRARISAAACPASRPWRRSIPPHP